MAKIDASRMSELGFAADNTIRKPQATVIIAGLEGTGKTHWALTGPKPLFYMSTDFGDEGVIQKAARKDEIFRRMTGDYKLEIPIEYRAFIADSEKPDERRKREGALANFAHEKFYLPFFDDMKKAVEAGVRTIVWDNALDVWEYTRLSVYGRIATNRSDLQREANSKFIDMVRHCNIHNVNLIMINHLKNAWTRYLDEKTQEYKWIRAEDKFEMQGFDKAPFLVTCNLWTRFTEGKNGKPPVWELEVRKCRDRPEFVGQVLPALPFPELMAMLIPDVAEWED